MKLPKEKRLELIAKWEKRLTQKDLAKEYGITLNALRAILFRSRHREA